MYSDMFSDNLTKKFFKHAHSAYGNRGFRQAAQNIKKIEEVQTLGTLKNDKNLLVRMLKLPNTFTSYPNIL